MISIIVCHRDEKLLMKFKQSVKNTIGVPFEYIIIDNKINQFNIFQAYNIGIKKSKYEILCFSHEDIVFHTKNWGERVVEHFKYGKTGLIGVAGGNAFPNCPASWWNDSFMNDQLTNYIQHWREGEEPIDNPIYKPVNNNSRITRDYQNPENSIKSKAVAIDGVWMCAHRNVFEKCSFDEQSFNGFHCYDTDISFQIGQYYDIYVVFDILIEHFSMGNFDMNLYITTEMLADKWSSSLPIFAKDIDSKSVTMYNNKCLLTYCYLIQEQKYPDNQIRKIIKKYFDKNNSFSTNKEYVSLILWMFLGHKIARYPLYLLKTMFRNLKILRS